MKIIVLVKQTFDTEARITLLSEGRISEDNIKKIMNPYDEYAVEEAVRIKEALGGDITVISIGPESTEEVLRLALAMGADEAILINDPLFIGGDASTTARGLADIIGQMEFDLILAGWVSIDDGCAQTASRVAEVLGIPQVTVITELKWVQGKARVKRETDEGIETIEVALPALLTVQKGINEPRYPSFKGIMQAKKKELKTLTAEQLGIDISQVNGYTSKTKIERIEIPGERAECKIMEGEPDKACEKLVYALNTLNVKQ